MRAELQAFLDRAPRFLFFTGKGGVGKTSIACSTAIQLADLGRRVLLVSTDPASNLDEALGLSLGPAPTAVPGAAGLWALNIDPEAAAHAYRERLVAPYRGVLPAAALASITEQLSGACTVEIAAFDEFSKLLGDSAATAAFDHVLFDTAPTGHTLRLLELPAAWSGFLDSNAGGVSCLGPLAGLVAQRALYDASRQALTDPQRTVLVLVSRADPAALREAERTRGELAALGVTRQELVLNAIFLAQDPGDVTAQALQRQGAQALSQVAAPLAALPTLRVPLLPTGLVGVEALRALLRGPAEVPDLAPAPRPDTDVSAVPLSALLPQIAGGGRGVVMTMGKGGVGKTAVAVSLAVALAQEGYRVHLTTTDPAAHVAAALGEPVPGLRVSRIDPAVETRLYTEEVLATAGAALDSAGRALLEEDLRSPCTEEIAVFRAFARVVAEGQDRLVVIDTAPTGHTLLLLDAAEAYHREVARTTSAVPAEVRALLPRLRDPAYTRVLLVTLPEATPVHEAARLQADLGRAGIRPLAWIINQSLTPLPVTDPILRQRRASEARFIAEVQALSGQVALVPWRPGESLCK